MFIRDPRHLLEPSPTPLHTQCLLETANYLVAKWYGAGLATREGRGSRVQIPPMAAVYQRQLSMPSLRGRLMSTSEIWAVNGHTTRCTAP